MILQVLGASLCGSFFVFVGVGFFWAFLYFVYYLGFGVSELVFLVFFMYAGLLVFESCFSGGERSGRGHEFCGFFSGFCLGILPLYWDLYAPKGLNSARIADVDFSSIFWEISGCVFEILVWCYSGFGVFDFQPFLV